MLLSTNMMPHKVSKDQSKGTVKYNQVVLKGQINATHIFHLSSVQIKMAFNKYLDIKHPYMWAG